jgi:hypothetical protein
MTWWLAPCEWNTPLNQRGPFGEFLASAGKEPPLTVLYR